MNNKSEQQELYLSGLLIGHEIGGLEERGFGDSREELLVGANYLNKVYSEAFKHLGFSYHAIDGEEATVRGLYAVWKAWCGKRAEQY